LEALLKSSDKEVHAFEPNPAVLRAVLESRDCVFVLERLASLTVSKDAFRKFAETLETDELSTCFIADPQTQALEAEEIRQARTIFWSGRKVESLRPSIAVVGPVYGGSLPIAAYLYKALRQLGHRVQYFDLADFYQPYLKIKSFVSERGRVDTLQTSYVEMLSKLVLESLAERPVDLLISLAQAPLSPDALTELRNRGVVTAQWFVEDCRRFPTWQHISRFYDYMFLIQDDPYLSLVEAAGAGRAIYLPLACDPEIHRPLELTEEEKITWGSPISFVGAGYNNRRQSFAGLVRKNLRIWGTEWPRMYPFDRMVQDAGRRVTPEEYVKIFNASTINLNLHSSTERDGVEPFGDFVNPRTFELAACGAFQLVDERKHLSDMFEIGSELATFTSIPEMEEKIDYYMSNPRARHEIQQASRARVLRDHTYQQRVKQLLGYIFADKFEYFRGRMQDGPWPRTLTAAEKYPDLHRRFEKVFQRGDDPTLLNLVADIQQGKGALSEDEQKLMFLHNLKSQIAYVNELRQGKRA
ncbi:MAG: glycosyltransferase, partial [Bdellovibrionales bacterium]|nr:glycosyltransferase [Bdellovibrionales bacterium]